MKRIILSALVLVSALSSQADTHYKGDVNNDGLVDLADMATLATAIKEGKSDQTFDLNVSGKVDETDLHFLADLIISGKLVEDTGFNVGIGGWDEDEEDYGGTLGAPALAGGQAGQTLLYLRNPRRMADSVDKYSIEFGISEGSELPVGFLINLLLPGELTIEAGSYVQLSPELPENFKIYGTPVLENPSEDGSLVRFIIFSQDATPLPSATGVLGQINYSVDNCFSRYQFRETQMYSSGSVTTLSDHEQYIRWNTVDDTGVTAVAAETETEVYGLNGLRLLQNASAAEIESLSPGIYILCQSGRTFKFIKR